MKHNLLRAKVMAKISMIPTFAILGLLAACGGTSPDLVRAPVVEKPMPTPPPPPTPPPTPTPPPIAEAAVVPVEAKIVPKADILFVIDTSDSMKPHIENLYKNVNRFVEAFQKNKELDFRIGVMTVWDAERFGFDKVVPNPYPLGKLRLLKDPKQPGVTLDGGQYVARKPGWTEVLAATLKVAIESRYQLGPNGSPVKGSDGKFVDGGGPEYEDLFSPVRCGLNLVTDSYDPIAKYCDNGQNGDFVRPDAHLAVIFVTDADDGSGTQASQIVNELRELKRASQKTVSTYGVLAVKDKAGNRCSKVDPGLKVYKEVDTPVIDPKTKKPLIDPKTNTVVTKKTTSATFVDPVKILEVLNDTESTPISLCDPAYGDKLAQIGRSIEDQSSNETFMISLKDVPQPSTLHVTYTYENDEGRAETINLPPGAKGGWSYDETTNSIQIHGSYTLIKRQPGGKIGIKYTPVCWECVNQGNVDTGL